jgi:hypothetical protein
LKEGAKREDKTNTREVATDIEEVNKRECRVLPGQTPKTWNEIISSGLHERQGLKPLTDLPLRATQKLKVCVN